MGFVGWCARYLFVRLIPITVLCVGIFVAWLNDEAIPEGRLYATVFPLFYGKLPATIVGHGKMDGVPPVPDDMIPQPRPENETFLELPGDQKMPQQGIGMCCRWSAYDNQLVERTVLWFLLQGGRHVDGAQLYLNHAGVGKGIQEAVRRGVPREEIFLTSKLFPSHYGYNTTMETVSKFLDELGVDYLDMVLMHSPVRFPGIGYTSEECSERNLSRKDCREETFKALSGLREKGITRNIGVSNFAKHHLQEMLEIENAAPIANNQIQFNPWLPQEWMDTVEFCHENNIAITGYLTLGGSLQHHEAHTIEVLTELAAKYEKSVAQVMLRWALQKNTAVIPGTGNPKHMRENLAVYSFALTEADVSAIDELRTAEEMKKFLSMKPWD